MNRFEVTCFLYDWINELNNHIKEEDKVLFMHIDVDVISGEITTTIKVANNDRKLQRPKQKTA